jgi:hypothetical protein
MRNQLTRRVLRIHRVDERTAMLKIKASDDKHKTHHAASTKPSMYVR